MSNAKEEGFNHLVKNVAANIPDTIDEKKSAIFKLTLAIIGILAFVGYEAIKIIFRKNFGMTKGAYFRLALCFLGFGGVAIISFISINATDDFATELGTPNSHLVIGILYSLLAVTILIKGVVDRNKQDDDYTGDSNLLGFLKKEGWSQQKIQNFAEPLVAITLGATICLFDLIGGLPLIFCAVSTWASLLYDVIFHDSSLQANINKINTQSREKSGFHEIKPD